jgi:hypothetical protein
MYLFIWLDKRIRVVRDNLTIADHLAVKNNLLTIVRYDRIVMSGLYMIMTGRIGCQFWKAKTQSRLTRKFIFNRRVIYVDGRNSDTYYAEACNG